MLVAATVPAQEALQTPKPVPRLVRGRPFGKVVRRVAGSRTPETSEGDIVPRVLAPATSLVTGHVSKEARPPQPPSDGATRETTRRRRADAPLPRVGPLAHTGEPTRGLVKPVAGKPRLLRLRRRAATT